MTPRRFIPQLILSLCITICLSADIDYTSLMQKYYLLCGPEYLCMAPNATHQFDIIPQNSYRHLGLCPHCLCDYGCVRRGDCCPDVFFRFPKQQCVNRTIIQGRKDITHDQEFSELMVTTCPEGSDKQVREKCEGTFDTNERLQNVPITSKENFALTYVNKYCAQCHGVKNVLSWSLDIDCAEFADFNFLSTLGEVINLAYDSRCIFQAYISERDLPIKVNPEICYDPDSQKNRRIYTKCNETGLWRTLDPSIHYACESRYHMEYRVFKNIFCYMCNPSVHKDHGIIHQCNVTGIWDSFEDDLKQACTELPEIQATIPYKNIFCYLCNKRNGSGLFEDIKGSLIEFPISHHHFSFIYDLFIDKFDILYFVHVINGKIDKNNELGSPLIKPFSVDTIEAGTDLKVNLTALILLQLSMYSEDFGVCQSRSPLLHPFCISVPGVHVMFLAFFMMILIAVLTCL